MRILLEEKEVNGGTLRYSVKSEVIDELMKINPLDYGKSLREVQKDNQHIPADKAGKIKKLEDLGYKAAHAAEIALKMGW